MLAFEAGDRDRVLVDTAVRALEVVGAVSQRLICEAVAVEVDGVLVVLVRDGEIYVKADGARREALIAGGSKPFQPFVGRGLRLHYYSLPEDLRADSDYLAEAGRDALAAIRRLAQAIPGRPAFTARRID